MRILVATPFMSGHYDAGLFWVKAMSNRGHSVYLWDYRIQREMPKVDADLSIVFKGESVYPCKLPRPAVNYFPDWFARFPDAEEYLKQYDRVFTPVYPTPSWATWLPSGWDPTIHINLEVARQWDTVYIGTANSEYKVRMIKEIQPDLVFGNNWQKYGVSSHPPVYLHDLVQVANRARLLIDIHQEHTIGFNRKAFELAACGPTIYDHAPGVEEVFGNELASEICFASAGSARVMIKILLNEQDRLMKLWKREREAIQLYTYEKCLDRMLNSL